MTVLYKLAREQLSKQHHYDFGLRALKSVLVMAGALKRGAPDMPEALVLMRALRDSNLPKFVCDDVPLFLGLVGDLFPGELEESSEVGGLLNSKEACVCHTCVGHNMCWFPNQPGGWNGMEVRQCPLQVLISPVLPSQGVSTLRSCLIRHCFFCRG
jgi:hypothetical protein